MNLQQIKVNKPVFSLAAVKGVNESTATIDFTHSTTAVDRDSEVIKSDGDCPNSSLKALENELTFW